MIYAGALDTVIDIQSVTAGADGMGAPTETWATLTGAPTRAQYIPLRGNELIEAGKLTANVMFKLRIRRTATVTPACRVVTGGITAKITAIEDAKRNGNDMVLWCEGIAA
jgi:SPP1 family predicted phage head-tail adaptor